jgi:hypothetical protein
MAKAHKPIPETVQQRAATRYTVLESGCWESNYAKTPNGYATLVYTLPETGMVSTFSAHRAAYTAVHGPIPQGMVVDHTCFNRGCINPAHLRLLTLFENSQRQKGAQFPIGQCRHGHGLEHMREVNWKNRSGKRICGACLDEKNAYNSWLRSAMLQLAKSMARAGIPVNHPVTGQEVTAND